MTGAGKIRWFGVIGLSATLGVSMLAGVPNGSATAATAATAVTGAKPGKIAFTRGPLGPSTEIYRMRADGSKQTNLTNYPGPDYDAGVLPEWPAHRVHQRPGR